MTVHYHLITYIYNYMYTCEYEQTESYLPRTGVPVDNDASGFLFESPRDCRPSTSYGVEQNEDTDHHPWP